MASLHRIAMILTVSYASLCSSHTHATWSIVAVDPKTREVGLAAATCNPGIQFIAATVPGSGVVAAQVAVFAVGVRLAAAPDLSGLAGPVPSARIPRTRVTIIAVAVTRAATRDGAESTAVCRTDRSNAA